MDKIRVTLKAYLAHLREVERAARSPAERRARSNVPTMKTLSEECNIDHATMSMLANNQRFNPDHVACIAGALFRRGYPVTLNDLLELDLTPIEGE